MQVTKAIMVLTRCCGDRCRCKPSWMAHWAYGTLAKALASSSSRTHLKEVPRMPVATGKHGWKCDPDEDQRELDQQQFAARGLSDKARVDSDNKDDSDSTGLNLVANLQNPRIAVAYVGFICAARADFKNSGLYDSFSGPVHVWSCCFALLD